MEKEKFISLNDDEKTVLKRRGRDLFNTLKQLMEWGEKDEITEEMRETLLNLIQLHLNDIKKTVGYTGEESESEKSMTKSITKHMQEQIQELQEMVNNQNSLLPVKQQLDYIHKKIDKWWDEEGFNYISDLVYTSNGNIKVSFGFMLENLMLNYSDTPDSDEKDTLQKIQNFKEQGYLFVKDKDNTDKRILDCDSNRELLTNLFHSVFPTGVIVEWKNYRITNGPDKGKFYLKHFEVIIYDYKELENLSGSDSEA